MSWLNPWEAHGGTVKLLNASVMVSGSESWISSHVVTLFEIDGMTVEYTGSPLPLADGETAIAVGWPPHNGILKACFVALPARSSLSQPYHGAGYFVMGLLGLIFAAFSIAGGALLWAALAFAVGAGCTFFGFAWFEGRALAIRHMSRYRR